MYYIRYYKGEKVYVTGTYSMGMVNYSIIEDVKGQESVVPTAELLHERPEVTNVVSEVNIDSTGVNISGENIVIKGKTTEAFEKSFKDANGALTTYGKTARFDESEKSDTTVVENETHRSSIVIAPAGFTATITTKSVFAINKKGKRTKLGAVDQLNESTVAKKLGLNPEAIQLVLDGKQKQHKGFTFETK